MKNKSKSSSTGTSVLRGQIVDVSARRIFPGSVHINRGSIDMIVEEPESETDIILPGLVDSHVHIESSMLTPDHFALLAASHGTIAVVADPHEIANVCGMPGVDYMVNNAQKASIAIYFSAPSCVPATSLDSSGAVLGVQDIASLLARKEFVSLGEMMNYPGVLSYDSDVWGKINIAKELFKPIDGHAPGLNEGDLDKYIAAGISTDHECETLDEARKKASLGMMIQIRQGSAAKNFDVLLPLLKEYPDQVMFCTDDCKAIDLQHGHIDVLVKRALAQGYDLFDVLRASSWNAVCHYNLDVGMLQEGDRADLIVIEDFNDFRVKTLMRRGVEIDIQEHGVKEKDLINHFFARPIFETEIVKPIPLGEVVNVIGVQDKTLATKHLFYEWSPDLVEKEGLNKIVVVNRYQEKSHPAVGWVKGLNIQNGAIASTISHDSHNIVAIGSSDEYITRAINALIEQKGGIVAVKQQQIYGLPLRIAGLMSDLPPYEFIPKYKSLDQLVRSLGVSLSSPFITLSFLSLPVIPSLRITDKGVFDVKQFRYL